MQLTEEQEAIMNRVRNGKYGLRLYNYFRSNEPRQALLFPRDGAKDYQVEHLSLTAVMVLIDQGFLRKVPCGDVENAWDLVPVDNSAETLPPQE